MNLIEQDDCIAVLIDVQEKLFPHISEYEKLEINLVRLVKGLQLLDVPLILSEQYKKGLLDTIPSLSTIIEPSLVGEKKSFSIVRDQDFWKNIQRIGKTTVILFGIEAHICVQQTALDLIQKNYDVVVVVDCIGSRNEINKTVAIQRMLQEGVRVATYESILFELCKTSENEQFKAISALVK